MLAFIKTGPRPTMRPELRKLLLLSVVTVGCAIDVAPTRAGSASASASAKLESNASESAIPALPRFEFDGCDSFERIDQRRNSEVCPVTVLVMNGNQLQEALLRARFSATPLTIVIDGYITPENSSGRRLIEVRDVHDVAIVGAGAGAEFARVGMRLERADNITVQSLFLPFLDIGAKEAMHLEGYVDHAWVDHSDV